MFVFGDGYDGDDGEDEAKMNDVMHMSQTPALCRCSCLMHPGRHHF
jgi:hypothetical protein